MTITVRSVAEDGTGGKWLGSLAQVTNWQHTITFPGGDSAATFDLAASADLNHPALVPGRLIYAKAGAAPVWSGRLDVIEKGQPWHVSCVGRAALAKDYVVTTTGSTLATVIAAAIGNGLPWSTSGTLASPNSIPQFTTVDAALGQLLTESKLWTLTTAGVLSTPASVPTAPTLLMFVLAMPNRTMQTYANVAVVSYTNTSGVAASLTVLGSAAEIALRGRVETFLDITNDGLFTSANATALGAAKLVDLQARTWTAPFITTQGNLMDIGGTAIDVATVRPGQTVRMVTLQYPDDMGTFSIDVPIGQVDYDDATGTVALTPRNIAANSFDKLIARIAPPQSADS